MDGKDLSSPAPASSESAHRPPAAAAGRLGRRRPAPCGTHWQACDASSPETPFHSRRRPGEELPWAVRRSFHGAAGRAPACGRRALRRCGHRPLLTSSSGSSAGGPPPPAPGLSLCLFKPENTEGFLPAGGSWGTVPVRTLPRRPPSLCVPPSVCTSVLQPEAP